MEMLACFVYEVRWPHFKALWSARLKLEPLRPVEVVGLFVYEAEGKDDGRGFYRHYHVAVAFPIGDGIYAFEPFSSRTWEWTIGAGVAAAETVVPLSGVGAHGCAFWRTTMGFFLCYEPVSGCSDLVPAPMEGKAEVVMWDPTAQMVVAMDLEGRTTRTIAFVPGSGYYADFIPYVSSLAAVSASGNQLRAKRRTNATNEAGTEYKARDIDAEAY
ncbi:hypothetical protein C2845_PM06G34970 [Panicum miliaceum]|uniref:Uncharacterized protein n=1 Tax=Panicum miliaceum TaxID=4540 RepID=A0A3L6RFK7_PANMI|nr:hypothetical protein C2845_PM06G34970 [Panicum miliaceum]